MVIKNYKNALFVAISEIKDALNLNDTFIPVLKTIIRTNQNWEIADGYFIDGVFDLEEWKNMSIDYFSINKKRLQYILDTIENEFLAVETTINDDLSSQTSNDNTTSNSNVDYMGGEGINDKSTTNQIQNQTNKSLRVDSTIDKRETLNNFKTITNNSLFRDWLILWVNDLIFLE